MDGTIIVTGCASGLGLAAVSNLLNRHDADKYQYIFTVRSSTSSSAAQLESLVKKFNTRNHDQQPTTPSGTTSKVSQANAQILSIDLANFDSIRSFAKDINDRVSSGEIPSIKAMILNAGLQFRDRGPTPVSAITETSASDPQHDIEISFMVNYLANFTMILLLLQSLDKSQGRVVYTSSWTHDASFWINAAYKPDKIAWKDDECNEVAYASKMPEDHDDHLKGGSRRYGASKFFQVMGMLSLQRKLTTPFSSIRIIGVDPGGVPTNITRTQPLWESLLLTPFRIYAYTLGRILSPNGIIRTPAKSGGDLVHAALDDLSRFETATPGASVNAGLHLNGDQPGWIAPEALDPRKQDLLFRASLKIARLDQDDTVLPL